jgi:hypothetical protein
MRPGPLLLAVLLLNGCVTVEPPAPKTVEAASADARTLAPMLQSITAGPLRVDSVVYKPAVLPLGGFLKKLSRGAFKDALASVHFKYVPSNVNDEALQALIKRGYIPVLAVVTNAGDKPVDARGLSLTLRDASVRLAPIPNAELPREFESLDLKAVAVNTYNVAAIVVISAALLVTIVGLSALAHGAPSGSISDMTGDSKFGDLFLFSAVKPATPIDYNGLLFHPGTLQPGESARGLLFFKARGVDWTGLRLAAAQP